MTGDDLLARAQPYLQLCGACDAGLPMSCTCPTGDHRPVMAELVAEVERLRAALLVCAAVYRRAREEAP